MARGTDPLNDPRWEGLDSQSLPDRAAHPDPSKVAEFGDVDKNPIHGVFGFTEHKHGIADEKEVRATLKAARSGTTDDRPDVAVAGNALAQAVVKGEVVPSVEQAPTEKGSGDGKKSGERAANAPVKS